MKPVKGLSLFLMTLIIIQMVLAVEESNETSNNESEAGPKTFSKYVKAVKTGTPVTGTKKFISKQTMRKKLLEQQTNFPYDMNEAIAWVRTNKISILDPVTKKTLFVNILSDEQIKAFLLKPLGRRSSGIDEAGLEKSASTVTIVDERASKNYYSLSSHRKDIENNLGPGQSGKKELPYYLLRDQSSSEPPQSGNLNEEYAWIRGNIQTIYDPFKKQTISVTRTSQEYLKYLLKAPQVRKNIGLPASDVKFEKSSRFS